MSYANDFPTSSLECDLIVDSSSGVPIKKRVIKEIGVATPIGKGKEKKIKRNLSRNLKLRRVLRVLRLAMVRKVEKVLQLVNSLLFLRTLRKWTPLLLERRLAILSS